MAGRQQNLIPIIMPGTPEAGQLYQTDAANVLVKIPTAGAADGWVVSRNTTSGLYELRAPSSAGDPGAAEGTPGNWIHSFVTQAGGPYVLGNHGTAVEHINAGWLRRVLVAGAWLRGQSTVHTAGFITAYLDCLVSFDDGATWDPSDLLGLRIPLKDVKHAVGLAFQVPEWAEGDVLLRPVMVGGNGVIIPKVWNLIIESIGVEPPPLEGEGGPVDAEIPQYANLIADWALTEGSGQSIANKKTGSDGTPPLIVGATTSVETNDAQWASDPRRMTATGLSGFLHQYCHASGLPSIATGFAYFFPFRATAGPGDKFVSALASIMASSLRGRSGYIFVNNAATKIISASLHDETGTSGGFVRGASATTPFVVGNWYYLGLWFDGDKVHIVVNGVDEGQSASFTGNALSAAGEDLHIGWPSDNLSFAVGFDNCEFGDPLLYIAPGLTFTADELMSMYLYARLTYPGLPAP